MEEEELDQEEVDLVGLGDQEDLEVDVVEFVQPGKEAVVLLVLLVPGICPHLECHLENGLGLCYLAEMLHVSHLLEGQLYLLQTSGLIVWFSLTAFQIDSGTVYCMELQQDFVHAILF